MFDVFDFSLADALHQQREDSADNFFGTSVIHIRELAGDAIEKFLAPLHAERAEVLMLGSSRMTPMPASAFPGKRFFNAAVQGALLDDLLGIYGLYDAPGRRPNRVVVNVDPWTESYDGGIGGWGAVADERAMVMRRAGIPVSPWRERLALTASKWRTLATPEYFRLAVFSFRHHGARGVVWRVADQAQNVDRTDALTTIRIDEPNVADTGDGAAQLSPLLSQRRWEQEAEANVLERLEGMGLLAPVGEADKILETVLNNLVVTNQMNLERPLHARILLTSPLESFTVGHTLVLSRGLIDVLPDEASLATMLAHELSHVALGHQLIDTKFSFADRLMVPDGELLQTLRFSRTAKEEGAADEKVIELLAKSPYRDKLGDAGLFLRTLADHAAQLPRLIQPHIGDYMAANGQMTRLAELMKQAPALMPDSLEQIVALQLGARLVVDAWSGKVTLDRTPSVPLMSVREKMPFAVTPLMPVIRYASPTAPAAAGAPPVSTVGELRAN